MSTLTPSIHNAVFLFRDNKVELLRHGRMSAEAFVLLIKEDDPYMLIGDTVYALTEKEYYLRNTPLVHTDLSGLSYSDIIKELSACTLSDTDKQTLESIPKGTCQSCELRKHKEVLYTLYRKYKPIAVSRKTTYPEHTGPIPEVISSILDIKPIYVSSPRIQCTDCVRKHIAQAWILSKEELSGYADYVTFVIGHLAEALDECPAESKALKETLAYCIAKSSAEGKGFVPIDSLLCLLPVSVISATPDTAYEKEGMDEGTAARIREYVSYMKSVENDAHALISWIGYLASMADDIATLYPDTSIYIRKQRLSVAPQTVKELKDAVDNLTDAIL